MSSECGLMILTVLSCLACVGLGWASGVSFAARQVYRYFLRQGMSEAAARRHSERVLGVGDGTAEEDDDE